jgi:hypothetical protein
MDSDFLLCRILRREMRRQTAQRASARHSFFRRHVTWNFIQCFGHLLSLLNLNSVNQLIFVMVKCGVLFEVRTEFLNNI